jgi:hypothetical protein
MSNRFRIESIVEAFLLYYFGENFTGLYFPSELVTITNLLMG